MNQSRPILITGATGSIGSVLTARLLEAGHSIRAVVRDPTRAAGWSNHPNLEIITADLDRPESLHGCAAGCSLIYHCAAKLKGLNWARAQATNIGGTQAIVGEAIRAGVERLVYTSTIGVYGLTKVELITEDTPWAKYNTPYFKTKQEAEQVVWRAADKLPVTIARLGDVFGPGQMAWTLDLIQKSKQGLLPLPLDSESGFLNPVFIDNLIDALLLIGSHPGAAGEIFNVVDGTPIRFSDYFRWIGRLAGKPAVPLPRFVMIAGSLLLMVFDLLRGHEPSDSPGTAGYLFRRGKIHPNKINSRLGWVPRIPQDEAFTLTEQWLRR